MKKILAIALCVVMVLATGVVFAGAEIPSNISQVAGNWVTSQDDFATLDGVTIAWDNELSNKIAFDGKMEDWVSAGLSPNKIEPRNMVSWVGGSADGVDATMPANFSVTYYVAADSHYLYIGFYVVDDQVIIGDNAAGYNGDAFQVCLDFGGILTKLVKEDPESAGDNPKNIFYSFSMVQNAAGELQPMQIMVQENGDDTLLDTQDPESGAKGGYGLTEDGWCAEFALSWERLYYDFSYKSYRENPEDQIKVGFGPDEDLVMGGCIYYLNKDENKGVNWAAGTTAGETKDDGTTPVVTWTAYDNSVNMVLKYKEGMEFPDVPQIVITTEGTMGIEIPTEGEDEETDPPAKETTVDTKAPEVTQAATVAGTAASTEKASGTTATTDDSGCASVVAGGAIAVVLSAMAAAVALKKKH